LGIPVELVQFLLNLCWNRDFLLCNTISSDYSQISFPWRWGVGKFGKAGVGSELGVGISESRSRESGSETLERSELESDILPTTSQPCL